MKKTTQKILSKIDNSFDGMIVAEHLGGNELKAVRVLVEAGVIEFYRDFGTLFLKRS